jgi:ATP-dependent Lon protease
MKKDKKTSLLISRGIVILPNDKKIIEFARPQSILTIQNIENIKNDNIILVSQIDDDDEDPDVVSEVFSIGTLCSIKKSIKKEENGEIEYSLELIGRSRVKIFNQNFSNFFGYECDYEIIKDDSSDTANELIEIIMNLNEAFEELLKIDYRFRKLYKSMDLENNPIQKMDPIILANRLAIFIENNDTSIPLIVKQQLLETNSAVDLLKVIYNEILRLLDPNGIISSEVDSEINEKINKNLARQQKEFYLREKLRVIREDLGEINSKDDEIEKIKKRVSENPYPQIIKDKILSELAKYESSMSSNENTIIITYID